MPPHRQPRLGLRLGLAAAAFALAVGARGAEVYVQYQRWTWTEEDAAGRRLLKEEGPLLGLGVTHDWPLGRAMEIAERLEGFVGEVDYDGRTQLGDPVRTTTEYYGLTGELDARLRVPVNGDFDLLPFAGLGARAWLRRIDNTSRFSSGYDETWLTAYARAGGRFEWRATGRLHLFASAALRIPLYNRARYSLSFDGGDDHVTVEPGRETTVAAEAGATVGSAHVAVFYEQLKFSRSDSESVPPFEVFQPESEGRLIGLKLGIAL